MAERTALEALMAELLGDVGQLHDGVKLVAELLPNTVAHLNHQVRALGDAADRVAARAEERRQAAAEAAAAAARREVQAAIAAAQAELYTAAAAAARAEIGHETRAQADRLKQAVVAWAGEMERARASVADAAGDGIAARFASSAAGGFFGSLIALTLVHFIQTWLR